MLLIGHEHIMKAPEHYLSGGLIIVGLALIIVAIYCKKSMKAHIVAYTMFP